MARHSYILAILITFLLGQVARAQTWNINMTADSISVTGPFSDNRNIVFSNRYTQYDSRYLKFGLHFKNNQVNQMNNRIGIANLFGSPTLGAWGPGTEVVYNGRFQSDGGQSVPHLVVQNGGKIRFGAPSVVDLVLPGSFFTRQFWCMGDGTGIIEMDPGFIADRTLSGLVDTGLGSIRLNKVIFITHETQGLPLGYRPNPALINSHFVFERNPGSVWRVETNDQEYAGGLWISQDMTLDARKNVNVTGVKTIWPDYVNFGGVFLEDTGVTLTKTGPASFILSGEHGYALDTRFRVQEGSVEFRTDPFNEADSTFYSNRNRKHGQNLGIELEGSSRVVCKAASVRLREVRCQSPQARTEVWNGSRLIAKSAVLNGEFHFRLPNGLLVSAGDSFTVVKFGSFAGRFSQMDLPTYNNAISWDTTGFYSRGVLKIATGSVVTGGVEIRESPSEMPVFPNPASEQIRIFSSEILQFSLMDLNGRMVLSEILQPGQPVSLSGVPSGVFRYEAKTQTGKITRGKLVRK